MKKSHKKQKGFFAVGIGLGLFAAFSAITFGLSSIASHEENLAAAQQLETPVSTAQVAQQIRQ